MIGSFIAAVLAGLLSASAPIDLPTGQRITPLAAPNSSVVRLSTGLRADGNADASGAMSMALSPDGRTLLVLTSGYNYQYFYTNGREIRFPVRDPRTGKVSGVTTDLTQWIFVYRVANGSLARMQRIAIPNAFQGLDWALDGRRFYVSGGIDDRVAVFGRRGDAYVFEAPEILLGHDSRSGSPFPAYDGGILARTLAGKRGGALGLGFGAMAAGIALSGDGRTLAVANLQNDSLSVADTSSCRVVREVTLHAPGSLTARGEYPYGVAILSTKRGTAAKIYVSSLRDGDVSVVVGRRVVKSIALGGESNALALAPDGGMLYVANGDLDEVDAIETASDRLVARIGVDRPGQRYRGANPNGIAIDARAHRLYVTLGGENAIAVVDLVTHSVVGRIPTGWYPTDVTIAGGLLFVTDAKGIAGPNPAIAGYVAIVGSRVRDPTHRDQYVLDLEKADLLTIPVPDKDTLASLSGIVDDNNGFSKRAPDATVGALRGRIKHVIFI
ncbi:MAG: YncE family protein, partial [Candidatus Eremiobacteraeota bacterium]|nr:YncE family protein [Candidatus Eremiobacteraeota bacterium]